MRYVVGYSANARGHDAVNLAVALARGRGASLDLVLVVPEVQQFGAAHAPKAGFETLLNEQAREWLDEALALVPADVPAQAHIRSGDSDAAGADRGGRGTRGGRPGHRGHQHRALQTVHHRFGGQRAAPRLHGSGGPGAARLPPHGGPDQDQLRPRHPGRGREAARLRHRHGGEPEGPVAGGIPAGARRRRLRRRGWRPPASTRRRPSRRPRRSTSRASSWRRRPTSSSRRAGASKRPWTTSTGKTARSC